MAFENPSFRAAFVLTDRAHRPLWKRVHEILARGRRKLPTVPLEKVVRLKERGVIQKAELVVIPGFLVGPGEPKESLRIACLKASEKVRRAVENAGGRILSLAEAVKEEGPARLIT